MTRLRIGRSSLLWLHIFAASLATAEAAIADEPIALRGRVLA